MPNLLSRSTPRMKGQIQFTQERDLICVAPDNTIEEATRLMRRHHVGDVIVVDQVRGKAKPVGILTDRDIALCSGEKPASELKVTDIMSRTLATAHVGDDVLEMVRTMRSCGVTRLPVVNDDGTLAGIVTARQLLRSLTQALNDLCLIGERQHKNEEQARH